jgi:hypothetical protein
MKHPDADILKGLALERRVLMCKVMDCEARLVEECGTRRACTLSAIAGYNRLISCLEMEMNKYLGK